MMVELLPPKPGTRVSVSKSHRLKDGTWQYRVSYTAITEERERKTVGSKAEAAAAAGRLKIDSFATKWLGKEPASVSLTIEQLRDQQLKRSVGKDTIKHDEGRWKTIVAFFEEAKKLDTPVQQLKPTDVDVLRAWLLVQPTRRGGKSRENKKGSRATLSRATVNRHLALLRTAYNIAIESGFCKTNPVTKKHFFREKQRDRVVSPAELDALIAGTMTFKIHRADPAELRLAILLAYETSLREANLINYARRSMIDLDRNEWRVLDTKNDEGLVLPLSKLSLAELRARMDAFPGEQLFTVKPEAIGKRFAKLVRHLQINDLRFHDLRHTAATRFARASVDWKVIMRLGGWKSISSLMRYRKVDTRDLHAAIRQVERAESRAET